MIYAALYLTNYFLFSNPNLELVAAPALAPAEVAVDMSLMAEYQRDMDMATQQPLPEEDEDL